MLSISYNPNDMPSTEPGKWYVRQRFQIYRDTYRDFICVEMRWLLATMQSVL